MGYPDSPSTTCCHWCPNKCGSTVVLKVTSFYTLLIFVLSHKTSLYELILYFGQTEQKRAAVHVDISGMKILYGTFPYVGQKYKGVKASTVQKM